VVSLSGYGTKSYYLQNSVRVAHTSITQQDVQKLVQKTLSTFKVDAMDVIHYFPIRVPEI
jgi:cell division ATPase FtsA